MKEIQLTQGKVALVDDDKFEFLSQWKWSAMLCNKRFWYAKRSNGVYMHRVLLNLGKGEVGDHIDGDTLNNQMHNLRPSTYSGNAHNRRNTGRTRFKGVHFFKSHGKFAVRVRVNGVKRHVGYFEDETDAARAYDSAAIQSYGEFARTNQMLGLL